MAVSSYSALGDLLLAGTLNDRQPCWILVWKSLRWIDETCLGVMIKRPESRSKWFIDWFCLILFLPIGTTTFIIPFQTIPSFVTVSLPLKQHTWSDWNRTAMKRRKTHCSISFAWVESNGMACSTADSETLFNYSELHFWNPSATE